MGDAVRAVVPPRGVVDLPVRWGVTPLPPPS